MSLAQCLTTGTGQRYDAETETLIPMRGGGFDVIAFSKGDHCADAGMNVCPTIRKGGDGGGNMPAIAFALRGLEGGAMPEIHETAVRRVTPRALAFGVENELAHCLRAGASKADKPDSTTYIAASVVRRLTPRECERLQGFPNDYTAIPWRGKPAEQCPDSPRYKALGNSMAVPVMRWIGERIAAVEAML